MAEYTTFITYGNNTCLREVIRDIWPWVDEANAKLISEEALQLPMGFLFTLPLERRANERAYVIAKYCRASALKLKQEINETGENDGLANGLPRATALLLVGV